MKSSPALEERAWETSVASPCYSCVALVVVVCVSACACSLFCLFCKKKRKNLLFPVTGGEPASCVRHEVVRLYNQNKKTKKLTLLCFSEKLWMLKLLKSIVCVCVLWTKNILKKTFNVIIWWLIKFTNLKWRRKKSCFFLFCNCSASLIWSMHCKEVNVSAVLHFPPFWL